jgi:hypothetical protein
MKNHDKGSAQSSPSKRFGNETLTVHGEPVGKKSTDDQRKDSNQKFHGSVYKGYGKGR